MFGKAKRFEPEKVCGPPPTAYNPKLLDCGVGPASFQKDGRFKDDHQEGNLTRSHSSTSVCSGESSISTKSHQGKAKDHTTCNKRITDLQRELQNMTLERNQLLGKPSLRQSNKESESEAMSSDIRTLNQMIKELQGKLSEAKCLEEEKHRLENERDTALNHLETKEKQVDTLNKHIEDLRVTFNEKEEELTLKYEKELEGCKRNNETAVRQLKETHTGEINTLNKDYERVLQNKDEKFAVELENVVESHKEQVNQLQNELQGVKAELATSNEESVAKLQVLTSEVEKLQLEVNGKDETIKRLNQTIKKREKEAADEWIQRETAIMAQVAAEKQLTHLDYESRLREVYQELEAANEKIDTLKKERDTAKDDVAVFQVQMEAQLAALNEQYDQERSMLSLKLKEQMQEIEEINCLKLKEANDQLIALRHQLAASKDEFKKQLELLERAKEEQVLIAVQQALEPLESEIDDLKRDREELLKLKKEYQELQARIEPFWEQLEMYEAEKKVLLSQAQTAESSMASLASKYAQLLGHQNSKQKIHHLEKLKQDIFNLRKELTEKNLALEKEKKTRQKLETKLKEVTGAKKFDPSEAFKVPETPVAAPAAPLAQSTAKPSKVRQSIVSEMKRAPFRGNNAQSTGFFLSMDDVEKTKTEMERERREKTEQRRKASHNFEAFDVDLGNSRRETYDVLPKLNVTHCIDNKENSMFPHDLSGISPGDEMKKQVSSSSTGGEHLTSTPLQLRQAKQ